MADPGDATLELRAAAEPRAARIAIFVVAYNAVTTLARATALDIRARDADRRFRDVGLALREATEFGDGIAVPGSDPSIWEPVRFYADRSISTGIDSMEKVEALRADRARRAPLRYVLLILPPAPEHAPLLAGLEARCGRSRAAGPLVLFDLGRAASRP